MDRLFLLPLREDETLAARKLAIDTVVEMAGWTWDEVIEATIDNRWSEINQENLIKEANELGFVNQLGFSQPAMLA